MGSYARCKSCNSNLYLLEQKNELTFPTNVTCNICGNANNYQNYELTEERHDYQCSFCKKNFFIKRSPAIPVKCPHCTSSLYISSDGIVSTMIEGIQPDKQSSALGGILGGALVGSLFGHGGALVGGLLGGALGYQGLTREALYENGF